MIGRDPGSGICLADAQVSWKHAQIIYGRGGCVLEDLGSSNGTFIYGKRVQSGLAKGGDEIRLDTVRFMLGAPGQEMGGAKAPAAAATPAASAPAAAASGGGAMKSVAWVFVGLVVTGAIIGALVYFDVIKF